MVKAAEYYNLEKTAEVLSLATAEINRLREQGKLRGLRDGSNWKFLKDEIHSYLAEQIRARGGHQTGADSGSADSGDASSSSFDLLMENVPLPGDSQLVSVGSRHAASDIDLAAADDDLALAEETIVAAPPKLRAAAAASSPSPSPSPSSSPSSSSLSSAPPVSASPAASQASSSSPASASDFDLAVAEDTSGLVLAEPQHNEHPSPDIAAVNNTAADADIALADADDFDVMNISEATHVTPVKLTQNKADAQEDEGSEFLLAEETHVSSVVRPGIQTASPSASDFDLVPLDESEVLPHAAASEPAGVSLHKGPVRKAEGSSPQLGLAGQSGLDNLAEKSSGVAMWDKKSSSDDSGIVEFTLEPSSEVLAAEDNSESSSQVIAIEGMSFNPPPDGSGTARPTGSSEFGDFDDYRFGTDSGPDFGNPPPDNNGFDTSGFDTNQPIGGIGPAAVNTRTSTPLSADEYNTASLAALALAVVLLTLPAVMMIDMATHIWSWDDQPFILSSWLMGWFSGMLGLS